MSDPLAVIIEDDPIIADIFSTALAKASFNTLVISDGQDALDRLPKLAPALILLDLHLPSVPGIRVLQAIRAEPSLRGTRVIVTSADATQTQFLRDEADLVLTKPIGFNQLREVGIHFRQQLNP